MGARQIEVTREFTERYNCRDIAGLIELVTSDFRFKSMFGGLETGGVFYGHAGLSEYFKALDGAYEDFRLEAEDVLDGGVVTVVVASAHWRGHGSGASSTTPVFPVLWFRGDEVMQIETIATRGEAMAVAGLATSSG